MTTVTGKLINPDASVATGATVSFALQYPANDVPRQPGGDDIMPFATPTATVAADGSFSIAIIGNDQITPSGTTYLVTFNVGSNKLQAKYCITGTTFDLTSAVPIGSTPAATIVTLPSAQVPVVSPAPGSFTIAHGLGRIPAGAIIMPTSAGEIWFQSVLYDATNLYLVASDAGVTAHVLVW
jgi:hypothetical protein